MIYIEACYQCNFQITEHACLSDKILRYTAVQNKSFACHVTRDLLILRHSATTCRDSSFYINKTSRQEKLRKKPNKLT